MSTGYKSMGHHVSARLPLGPNQEHIGQMVLMCDSMGVYHPRVVLEPCPLLNEIHVLKLARELTDAFTHDKPLKAWSLFREDKLVFHTRIEGHRAYLFVSDSKADYQFGLVERVDVCDPDGMAKLICTILNGYPPMDFELKRNGEINERWAEIWRI